MQQLLLEIKNGWAAYRSGKTTNKLHTVHKLVVKDVPKILESWTPTPDKYKFVGSDGQGNILRSPWFATLNTEVTTSATKGYYLVYCVSEDFKTIFLTIGFGATQFSDIYGKGKKFFEKTEQAVQNMRLNTQVLLEQNLNKSREITFQSKPALTESDDFNLKAYQSCCIYAVEYQIANLPSEDLLRTHYQEYLKLYDAMVGSLLLPDVEDYVIESLEVTSEKIEVDYLDFAPRPIKKSRGSGSPNSNSPGRRSKSAHKVGLLGEEKVYEIEKEKLSKAGRSDLANKVVLHRHQEGDRTPGWDITSYRLDGTKKFIEVKSSESKIMNEIELTPKEWKMAQELGDSYEIYLVPKVISGISEIEIINNPAELVAQSKIAISTSLYTLNFQTKISE